jgi:hypothetical protein
LAATLRDPPAGATVYGPALVVTRTSNASVPGRPRHRVGRAAAVFALGGSSSLIVGEADAARFLARNEQMRVDGYGQMIDFLRAKSPLRADLSPERATDALLFLVSPAAYRALVVDRGWSHADWVAWSSETLTERLFGIQGEHCHPGGLDPP